MRINIIVNVINFHTFTKHYTTRKYFSNCYEYFDLVFLLLDNEIPPIYMPFTFFLNNLLLTTMLIILITCTRNSTTFSQDDDPLLQQERRTSVSKYETIMDCSSSPESPISWKQWTVPIRHDSLLKIMTKK